MEDNEPGYDRDAIASSLTRYYHQLARACYFSPTDIQSPPPEGWSDAELDVDALRALQRSDKATDLLRHIPYIRPLRNGQSLVQWPILVGMKAIRYLRGDGDFEERSSRGEQGLSELLSIGAGEAYLRSKDPDIVALGRHSGGAWCLIDCETGVLTSSSEYHTFNINWDKDFDPTADFFFDDMTAQLAVGIDLLPLPPVDDREPEILGSSYSGSGDRHAQDLRRRVEGIYDTFGWRQNDSNPRPWRRKECYAKLKRLVILMREAEKKRLEWEEIDEGVDNDYEDSNRDPDSEPESSDDLEVEGAEVPEDHDVEMEATEKLDEELPKLIADQEEDIEEMEHEPPNYGYDRDAVVDVFTRYYQLLSRMAYFPPTLVDYPPEGGWTDDRFPVEKLRRLGYSETVIDLLRHLPYLGDYEHDCEWELFHGSRPIRYLRDSRPFKQNFDTTKLYRQRLFKLKLSPYKDREALLPAEMVALSGIPGLFGHWYLIDTERGSLYVETLSDRKDYDPLGSRPWLMNKPLPIVPHLEEIISKTRSLEFVPIPHEDLEVNLFPHIWIEPDWSLGPNVLARVGGIHERMLIPFEGRWGIGDARNMYREFGWPDLEKFRREECIEALAELYAETVYDRSHGDYEAYEEADDDVEIEE
ncbi:hypothetical protein CMUS01_12573 [Colletotrichum musicola]|uniref:Uncharacterized protein n=1 Tax=Colletotrichum musicola TaxID=2175873 RepID=A0A8H6MZI8_9PEZI|nr:hypothetical protein CMUS01_12573 [Colletotrichum musicola]